MKIKNCLAALVFIVLTAGGIYAQSPFKLSAGIGGFIGGDFGGGFDASVNVPGFLSMDMSHKSPYYGGGVFIFLDATYAELSFGFFGGSGNSKTSMDVNSTFMTIPTVSLETNMSYMGLSIGFLGKYPFRINDKLSIFPLFGIDYQIMLSVKDEDGNEGISSLTNMLSILSLAGVVDNETLSIISGSIPDSKSGDFSALWFKFGAGADYSFNDKIYLRVEALYGFRLANKFEKDMVDAMNSYNIEADSRLGHGLSVKAAVGYRF
ncbi:MAG: hypothetical protein LBQ82_01590 [Treponema sp.]|jgi:hypothetical protein|nr:hypothetical protein [Treponema sp.]